MGLFDAIGSVVGTIMTNRSNRESVNSTNDVNAQIARDRNAAELALWREQTAYNSPEAQMKRLEAAGLNPNLVYGQIAESKMSNPPDLTVARMEAPHAEAPRFPGDTNPLAEYQQVKNLQALNAINNAEIVKRKSEAVSASAKAKYDTYETDSLIKSGTLKTDPTSVKSSGRFWDYIKKWWSGPWTEEQRAHARGLSLEPYVGNDEKAHIALERR